jgi:hypothetical protein
MTAPFALPDASAELSPATPAETGRKARDPRALRILAKSIYRELRQGGLAEQDVMAVAGDLLGLVAGEVKDRRKHGAATAAGR